MELVSIVITTYNRSDKLEDAIKSATAQTYKNIEVIVVDDNANNSEERNATKKILKKYPEVKLIENKENIGGAESRNKGIRESLGNYVAFLDDDDIYHKDKIEKQMKLMKIKEKEGKKVAIIYCYKNLFNDNGMLDYGRKIDVEGNCLFEHMMDKMETTSTWLCKKEALEDVGLFENVKAHQDNILLIKLLANKYEIYRVPEFLIDFYMHNGNGITKKNKNYIEYTKTLFDYKRKYYNLLSKKEIKQVEYKNSLILLNQYKKNNMKKDYKNELKKLVKNNIFKFKTIKMMLLYFKI